MKRSVRYAVALAFVQVFCLAEPTPSSAIDTCSSASINIITHGLPQQCLRTNWTSSSLQDKPTSTQSSPEASSYLSSKVESAIVSLAAAQAPSSGESTASHESARTGAEGVPTQNLSGSEEAIKRSTSVASSATGTAPDEEQDSFLDAAKFLSFEDWKKQKLGEAGNSAEALARSRGEAGRPPNRQRPGEGFDTLGEESEISLDFDGFANAIRPSPKVDDANQQPSGLPTDESTQSAPVPHLRSKDAGRTCKERFNYASFDCAATVLKTNSKCKSATSVLVENKDSYMLNECSTDNKFLIVELCEWVEIDTIVLANFEFFSSMFRTFRVSVSDRYPVKLDKWRVLGTFEARNTREIQAFLVENPMLWAKFLRIEFLTHYGNEFYCPLSLLRVHGTNMMEDFRRTNENDAQDEVEEGEIAVVPVSPQSNPETAGALPDATPRPIDIEIVSVKSEKPQSEPDQTETSSTCAGDSSPLTKSVELCTATYSSMNGNPSSTISTSSTFAFTQDMSSREPSVQSTPVESSSTAAPIPTPSPSLVASVSSTAAATTTASPSSTSTSSVTDNLKLPTPSASTVVSSTSEAAPVASHVPPAALLNTTSSAEGPKSIPTSSSQQQQDNSKSSPTSSSTGGSASSTSLAQASQVGASVAIGKEQTPSPHPPTQESIFKSITRRLSLLEANATLSLQYIESQSALLRSAFAATNAQQLNRTSTFLEKLDATVLGELARAKADYDQLWQSTVLELHGQREEGRKEREILGERVRLLAEEVVGTKRLMAAQATLLLIVLGLVIFTRNAPLPHNETGGSSVDLRFLSSSVRGLIQHGRSRSNLKGSEAARSTSGQRRRWQWDGMSPWASPPQTRPGTSASGDDDRDGHRLGRHSSDEAIQENLNVNNGQIHRPEKPLPPAPRRGNDDEQDHSDSAGERRDTVTLRNYRPNLKSLRIDMANETMTSPNGYYNTSPATAEDDYQTSMSNGDGIHAALLRDAQSAPTTPSIESSDPSAYQAESLAAQPPSKG